MEDVLLCWIGKTDIEASTSADSSQLGPIGAAIEGKKFSRVCLLNDQSAATGASYSDWVHQTFGVKPQLFHRALSSPMDYAEIYRAARTAVDEIRGGNAGSSPRLVFHLSPGTPAMATVWILLSTVLPNAALLRTSREQGVEDVRIPFEIAAEFTPEVTRTADLSLADRVSAGAPAAATFGDIVYRSAAMAALIRRAQRVAQHTVDVLIQGETGTGKELLARAIHAASSRRRGPFLAINCGAIPETLIQSELFGSVAGAFTGAVDHKGAFEAASGGTLFLDEIGEMPKSGQVALLRALQDRQVQRVGSTRLVPVDVRIIGATNRNLVDEVQSGRFREDLFYRLAIAVLHVPALRDREGDVGLLAERILTERNENKRRIKLSAGARRVLLQHSWPGNVRELVNTMRRVAVWAESDVISEKDAQDALLRMPETQRDLFKLTLGNGFDLRALMSDVAKHYLNRAMEDANGNKRRAAELLGMPSYQTLTNWLIRHHVVEDEKGGGTRERSSPRL